MHSTYGQRDLGPECTAATLFRPPSPAACMWQVVASCSTRARMSRGSSGSAATLQRAAAQTARAPGAADAGPRLVLLVLLLVHRDSGGVSRVLIAASAIQLAIKALAILLRHGWRALAAPGVGPAART